MDLAQYLHAMRARWWVILLPALAGLVWGVFTVTQQPDRYRATVTFFVVTRAEPTASSAVHADQFAQRRVASYVELLSSDRLAAMVAEDPRVAHLSQEGIRRMLSGSGDLETVLLRARATSESRNDALLVAEVVAEALPELVREIEASGGIESAINLEVVSGPRVLQVPFRWRLAIAIRVALGTMVGIGMALLLEFLDRAVRTEEHLEAIGADPLLGLVPVDSEAGREPLVLRPGATSSPRAESFRHIRTSLEFLAVEQTVQTLLVTSSVAAEGKSYVSSNLALVIASQERDVLLIEADLRRPKLTTFFPHAQGRGLSDVVAGRAQLDDVISRSGAHPRLAVMPSGEPPPNPAELLGSAAFADVLQQVRQHYDVIVVNAPPLLPVADGAVLAALVDGVVLVIRAGRTTQAQVGRSVRVLRGVGARILGSVLNMVPARALDAYGTYATYLPDEPGRGRRAARSDVRRPDPRPRP